MTWHRLHSLRSKKLKEVFMRKNMHTVTKRVTFYLALYSLLLTINSEFALAERLTTPVELATMHDDGHWYCPDNFVSSNFERRPAPYCCPSDYGDYDVIHKDGQLLCREGSKYLGSVCNKYVWEYIPAFHYNCVSGVCDGHDASYIKKCVSRTNYYSKSSNKEPLSKEYLIAKFKKATDEKEKAEIRAALFLLNKDQPTQSAGLSGKTINGVR
jgi:hypothetical protein